MANTRNLPKWAQDHIKQLERDIEHWQKLAHVDPGNPTRVQVMDENYRVNATERLQYLPEDSCIRYTVAEEEHGRTGWRSRGGAWVEVRLDKTSGNLSLSSSDGLAVYASASNVVKVGVVDRWHHRPLAKVEEEVF